MVNCCEAISLKKQTKEKVIKEHAAHETDTGSTEVQIGLLSERIKQLSDHLGTHKKDFHSRMGLLKMIGKRRRLLQYMESSQPKEYETVTKKLKLKA